VIFQDAGSMFRVGISVRWENKKRSLFNWSFLLIKLGYIFYPVNSFVSTEVLQFGS